MKTRRILRAAAGNAARDTAHADKHPEPDVLLGYARGEIEDEAKAQLQEHLSLCASCARAILDLKAFPYNPSSPNEDLSDQEIDAEWLRLVGRERGPGLLRSRLPWAVGSRFGVLGYGLAAAFFVALLGLSTWTIDLNDRVGELSEPRVNVFVAQMWNNETRGPSHETIIPATVKYVRFQLLVDDGSGYESYRVSIRDGEGREIISNSEITPGPEGDFSIEVENRQLPVGTGSIHVFGSIDGQESPLCEYAFSKLPPE